MGSLPGQLNRPHRLRQRSLLRARLPHRAWLALLLLAAGSARADSVLDRVVAQVDGQVITLSDLRFEARVALVERGGAPLGELPLDQAALSSALDLAIAQRAAGAEADRLGSVQLEAADVEARLKTFEARFSSRAALDVFLRANGADRALLAEVLGRALRAERALDARVRLRAQVTEADVRRAWEAAGSPGSFEQARGAIRDELVRARYQAAAREELVKLRAAAQVRLVARPADLAETR
ncbi:MAG TPA: hypothetical protein VEJ89_05745 [Myxococcaceae bacterium]|nr:hypothetical protein [Myxococcaceae bacterium]